MSPTKGKQKQNRVTRPSDAHVVSWKLSVIRRTYGPENICAGNYANVEVTCESAPGVMRSEGNSPALAALQPPLPLALALFTHLLILSYFHTPSSPSLPHQHHTPSSSPPPPPPRPPHCLPASPLSCSRCGVAIATEKCGNTSVLQSTQGGEAGRGEERADGRQTENEGADRQEERRRGSEERTVD